MNEQSESENNLAGVASNNFKSCDSPIVTEITQSKEDNEKVNLCESIVSKNKRVFVKSVFTEDGERMLNYFKEMETEELAGENLVCQVGVDKADYAILEPITITTFLHRNKLEREDLQFYRKGSNKFFKVNDKSFKLAGGDKELIVGVVTVPTVLGGLEASLTSLSSLLPEAAYKSLKVIRLDYDIVAKGLSHKELNRRLIVDRVKCINVYRYQSKALTRYHGLKPLMTVIYHMLKRHGVDAVKIEVRTWGKNIGVGHPDEIKNWLLSGEFNPFDNVKILNHDFQSDDRKRMIQFNTLADVLGIQFAKLYLNKNSNFARDFNKVIYAKEPILMSDIWKSGIKGYFENEGGYVFKTSTN